MNTATTLNGQPTRSHAVAATAPGTSRRRRVAEATAFVAVWITAGYLLHLPNTGLTRSRAMVACVRAG